MALNIILDAIPEDDVVIYTDGSVGENNCNGGTSTSIVQLIRFYEDPHAASIRVEHGAPARRRSRSIPTGHTKVDPTNCLWWWW